MYCADFPGMLLEAPGWACRVLAGSNGVTLLRHREALGDTLMLTPLARALKKHLPHLRVSAATRSPELFRHNPYFDSVHAWHLWRDRGTVRLNYRLEASRHPHYVEEMWMDLWDFLCARKLANGVRPEMDGRHPDLFLSPEEKARGVERLGTIEPGRPVLALISGGKLKPTHNREWGFENYAALAAAFAPHAQVVQISGDQDLLCGTGEKIPRISAPVREVAGVLARCDAFLTQEGGLMHVARAVNTPTVVIFGGTLWPEHSGYDRMLNLSERPACSPCRSSRQNCAHLKCMVPLTPRLMATKILELLGERGFKLPADIILSNLPEQWTPPEFVDRAVLKKELALK